MPLTADRSRIVATCAVTAALATVALTACSGSSDGSGSSPAATTASSTAVATATATATVTSSAAPTSGAASSSDDTSGSGSRGPATCREDQLRAQIDPRPIGASAPGDKAIIVQFINKSDSACTLHGYPGAALVNSSGRQVAQATRTVRGKLLGLPTGVNTLPIVTLKPGAVASAGIEGVNKQKPSAAQAACGDFYPGIVVTPPNTATPVPFTVKWPLCYSFTVHPTDIDKTAN